MYRGEHSIRFYPEEAEKKPSVGSNYIGGLPFDSADNLETWPDTWRTWHLIPSAKVIFQPPKNEENMMQIQGRHGGVDINRYVHDHPVFNNRTGSVEFAVDPDYLNGWPETYRKMVSFFQGKDVLAVLRDDKAYYYKGRFRVSELKPGGDWDTVKLEYSLEPFKYDRWYGLDYSSGYFSDDPVSDEHVGHKHVILTGLEYIRSKPGQVLSGVPGYGFSPSPKSGQALLVLAGQAVELEREVETPDSITTVPLAGNQVIKLAPYQYVYLTDGQMIVAAEGPNYTTIYMATDMVVPSGWNPGHPCVIEVPTEVTLTGNENLWVGNRYLSGGGSTYILAANTKLQPKSGEKAILEAGQTISPGSDRPVELYSGSMNEIIVADGQTAINQSDGSQIQITGGGWKVTSVSKMDIPADWAPPEITLSSSDPESPSADPEPDETPVPIGDGDSAETAGETGISAEPFGIWGAMLNGYGTWKALDLPENCYATPEFKMTSDGFPEVSIDEGITWHSISYYDWSENRCVQRAHGRILFRGTGTIKIRLRGGWL